MNTKVFVSTLLLGISSGLVVINASADSLATTERISVASDGSEANGHSDSTIPSFSADGRFVAFHSHANNLVPGDTNSAVDVFVHDRQMGTTELVSYGFALNIRSLWPSISADGRFVAFQVGDSGWIYVRDRQTGTLELVSVAPDGSQANPGSLLPAISADGRFVAFVSSASNLVPGDTNGYPDVFVRDRHTGTTERISVASDGSEANWHSGERGIAISADGRFVAFHSEASNLVPEDTNSWPDIFVRDRHTGTTERISVASDGLEPNKHLNQWPSISADGRFVSFFSYHIQAVLVRDRHTGTTEIVSWKLFEEELHGIISGTGSSISADGRFVAFTAVNTSFTPSPLTVSDIFVHDRRTDTTELASLTWDGGQGNNGSYYASINANGRFIAFVSLANNLVPEDTNGYVDVFVRDRGPISGSAVPTDFASVSGSSTYGGTATLTATLTSDGQGVSDKAISFGLIGLNHNSVGTATTNNNGTATLSGINVEDINAGTYEDIIEVVFAGDDTHEESSGNGALIIDSAPLTITANDTTKIYGQPNPAFTVSYSGFVLEQDPNVLAGELQFDTDATTASLPGIYAVTPAGLDSNNYDITYIAGELTILSAQEALQRLITYVQGLELHSGIKESFLVQLNNARNSLIRGQRNAAIHELNAFINDVQAQRDSLPEHSAEWMIGQAQAIINAIKLMG